MNIRGPIRLRHLHDDAFAEIELGLVVARNTGPSSAQEAQLRAALGLQTDGGANPTRRNADATPNPNPRRPGALASTRRLWLVGGACVVGVLALLRTPAAPAPVIARRAAIPAPSAQPLPQNHAVQRAAKQPSMVESPVSQPRSIVTGSDSRRAHGPNVRQEAGAAKREASLQPSTVREETSPDVREELALLKLVRAHARAQPERALALIAEHERRFAHGSLVEEREVLAIEALLAAHQRAAAEARAVRFGQRFPNSAHARRVQTLLNTGRPTE